MGGAEMMRVVFIEPNRNIREFCRRELRRDGYDVIPYRTVNEAMGAIRDVQPDVVVADAHSCASEADAINMLLEALAVPLVVHATSSCIEAPSPYGAQTECIPKSGDLRDLKSAIDRAISRNARAQQERRPHSREKEGRALRRR
jgi:DNA-binding NtrC family response regulator